MVFFFVLFFKRNKHYILFSLTTMYNNLIVSHVNKLRCDDISRYAIYRYGLTLYRYSDIVLEQYDYAIYRCISSHLWLAVHIVYYLLYSVTSERSLCNKATS